MLKNILLQWDCRNSKAVARTYSIMLFFILAFSAINTKLIYLSRFKNHNSDKSEFVSYYRKDITDRNGSLIATSIPTYSLFANPEIICDKRKVTTKLAKIIKNTNQKHLFNKLNTEQKFIWLARNLNPIQMEEINSLGIPGINFETDFKRIYSYGNLLSHILGYVSIDNKGLAGIERFFDESLLLKSDFQGENSFDQVNKTLELSIDVGMQNIVSEEIDKAIIELNAIGGVAVVVDPNNGEILSLVSKPDFNPHRPGKAKPEELFNKTSLGLYEFGSVFKVLTMAIALQTRTVRNINQKYDISYLKVGNFEINDFSPSTGFHTVADIFAKSSNKGTAKIGLDIGQEDFKKYLQKLKFDKKAYAEIPEITTSIMPKAKHWSSASIVTVSYGYGI